MSQDRNVCWVIHVYIYPKSTNAVTLDLYLRLIILIYEVVVPHIQAETWDIAFILPYSFVYMFLFCINFEMLGSFCCVNKKKNQRKYLFFKNK